MRIDAIGREIGGPHPNEIGRALAGAAAEIGHALYVVGACALTNA